MGFIMFSINGMRQPQLISLKNPPDQAKVLHVNIAGYSEHDEYIISSWGGENEPDPFNFIFPKLANLLTQCEINSYQYECLVKELPEEVRRTFREWASVGDSSVFDNVAAPAKSEILNSKLNQKIANDEPLSINEATAINNLAFGLENLPRLPGEFLRIVEHNSLTPSPWGSKIQIGDVVTCSPCFMSASATFDYAQKKLANKHLLNEQTDTIILYKIHSPHFISSAVPLLREARSNSIVNEDEVLFPQYSCFQVDGFAVAKPVTHSGERQIIRIGVLLTQVEPQLNVLNIYTGEQITLCSPGLPNSDKITPPQRHSDEYAEYVMLRAKEIQKNMPQDDKYSLKKWSEDFILAVEKSEDYLIDNHSSKMISLTIIEALTHSKTFRQLVNYGICADEEYLGDIIFRHEFEINYESPTLYDLIKIKDLSLTELKKYNSCTSPIIPICEAGEISDITNDSESESDSESMIPTVSFGFAPNEDSEYLQSWQEGLIHEVVHHIAGTKDPSSQDGNNRLGPTEIIARKVAKELRWRIQEFRGYMDDERTNHINKRNFEALLDTVGRYQGQEQFFFEKLYKITQN